MKNIFCRGFISLAFTLVAAATSFAQTKPLKIGETLPENDWATPYAIGKPSPENHHPESRQRQINPIRLLGNLVQQLFTQLS